MNSLVYLFVKGRVIVVTSVCGLISFPADSAYHATKHALETVSDSLRMEMMNFGVQFERYEAEADEMWRAASIDVKSTYRIYYLTTMIETQRISRFGGSALTTKSVIDAIEDALLDFSPKTRYIVPVSYVLLIYTVYQFYYADHQYF
ncbi:hypothetical protein CHS0354_007778 [Potamilus streckersoni]|uniref:Uncharacterized protein n=1 Tax=Potamilus streckersoni TaxID=2493646 RepID=A0AAE0RS60_9BIVA|nr:hypothetical protein CHS0354_007778 [Potamilus streckersoni]